jgi:hypothetical protein
VGNIGFVKLKELGCALRDEFNIATFVETGTYKANTTRWASERFKRVITIEAHRPYFDKAAHKLSGRNIEFRFGDSRQVLPRAIKGLPDPALVWLDAHWCGDHEQALGTLGECPLKEELAALRAGKVRHFILIDDARLFVSPPPKPHDPEQWPTFEEVKALLPEDYFITIWNDVIIAVPSEAELVVQRFTAVQDLQVVVLTSNDYVHCLPPFAYLFNQYWSKEQAVKVVRYDLRPPKLPTNFSNFAVGIQHDFSWSQGLLRYLAYHPGDLILLMLEDYFLNKPANVYEIEGMWRYMQYHPEVAKVDLTDDRLKVGHSDYNETMIVSDDDAHFQTSTQAAIWRKDYLLRFLHPDENPWQFERRGTKRVIAARRSGEFNGLILGFKKPPLSYVNAVGGEGNNPGAWDFKKLPAWMVKRLRERKLM